MVVPTTGVDRRLPAVSVAVTSGRYGSNGISEIPHPKLTALSAPVKRSARGVFSDVRVLEGSTETAIVSAEVAAPAFVTEGIEVSSSIPVVITNGVVKDVIFSVKVAVVEKGVVLAGVTMSNILPTDGVTSNVILLDVADGEGTTVVLTNVVATDLISAKVDALEVVSVGVDFSNTITAVLFEGVEDVFAFVEVNAGEVVSIGLVPSTCVVETNKMSGKVVLIYSVMGN